MKKILFVLTLAAGMVACESADKKEKETPVMAPVQEQPTAPESPADVTSIQWIDSTYMDLGKAKEGKVVEVRFRFKNTGDKPLVIQSVTAGCGCTVPEKPEKPILPGQEDVIKAAFESKGRPGENIKPVYVKANTNPADHELKFRVEVTN